MSKIRVILWLENLENIILDSAVETVVDFGEPKISNSSIPGDKSKKLTLSWTYKISNASKLNVLTYKAEQDFIIKDQNAVESKKKLEDLINDSHLDFAAKYQEKSTGILPVYIPLPFPIISEATLQSILSLLRYESHEE
jgi:hypothetical protein